MKQGYGLEKDPISNCKPLAWKMHATLQETAWVANTAIISRQFANYGNHISQRTKFWATGTGTQKPESNPVKLLSGNTCNQLTQQFQNAMGLPSLPHVWYTSTLLLLVLQLPPSARHASHFNALQKTIWQRFGAAITQGILSLENTSTNSVDSMHCRITHPKALKYKIEKEFNVQATANFKPWLTEFKLLLLQNTLEWPPRNKRLAMIKNIYHIYVHIFIYIYIYAYIDKHMM